MKNAIVIALLLAGCREKAKPKHECFYISPWYESKTILYRNMVIDMSINREQTFECPVCCADTIIQYKGSMNLYGYLLEPTPI